ncbi:molybdate ABC transporter substrate-binding protein [Clostridium frigidicarnis]|uniref:Molybdate transport system substrate-binding protein n=1 Tax=Clostridium frigidicarnis TaxID=84698 RepID=A0A1I0WFG4_9CLOT|nr:molybdate ABC transporter substrate-binding protein [Clostridium frigidicarnis]SFA86890.1 molybdate transport system substrate-binding protein [Clostridium frigidicarnis]
MKKLMILLGVSILIFSLAACEKNYVNEEKKSITISAAASLKEGLEEIKPEFEKKYNVNIAFNFGGSGTLQKQIEEGAPVDVFISAGKKQMDELEDKKLIEENSRKDLLENELVLVASNNYKDKIKNINDVVINDVNMSIGTVESVPAGQYAKEALTKLNLWDKISNKLVYAKDVKQVANYVDRGEVAAGIIYKSDAMVLKNSVIAQTFDEETHSLIVYPCGVIKNSNNKDYAEEFLEYLSSDECKSIFVKYGFKPQQ